MILKNIKSQFAIGSRLEITLYKGAEYDNGWGPAGASDPRGYYPCEEMTEEPGIKMTGYIHEFDETERYRRIFLTPIECENPLDNHFGRWYVMVECIHSFKK